MIGHSTPLTIYAAIWDNHSAAARCRTCNRLVTLDLRRLALDGHGREQLADIPFECDCGSSDREVVVRAIAGTPNGKHKGA